MSKNCAGNVIEPEAREIVTLAGFERLAQHVEHVAGELGYLIEEQVRRDAPD